MAGVVDRLSRAQDETVAIDQDLRHHGVTEDTHRRRPSMNPYTTTGQARIQQRDIETILQADGFLTATQLAALERQRGYRAEAEVNWLLKQYGVTPPAVTSRIVVLRQTLGALLVRVGERLAGGPGSSVSRETVPVAGTLGTTS
jgi:hypothetical protein